MVAYGVVVILLNYYLNRDTSKKPAPSDGTYNLSLSLSLSLLSTTATPLHDKDKLSRKFNIWLEKESPS